MIGAGNSFSASTASATLRATSSVSGNICPLKAVQSGQRSRGPRRSGHFQPGEVNQQAGHACVVSGARPGQGATRAASSLRRQGNQFHSPWPETPPPPQNLGQGMITDDVATAGRPTATPARKPTFLLKERWKAIQKARRKGMSLRAIERELGIHRATIKRYMDAEDPPTRQARAVVAATPSSDTIQA